MYKEETALFLLNLDGKCPEADDRLRATLVDLERSGIAPKVIAAALGRVLLGFCAEHARNVENFGWVLSTLGAVSALMNHRSKAARSNWSRRYLMKAHHLYETARFQIRSDTVPPPLPPFAVDFHEPAGRA